MSYIMIGCARGRRVLRHPLAFGAEMMIVAHEIDGYLACSRNWVTTVGKLMDPIADKLYATVVVTVLSGADYFFGVSRRRDEPGAAARVQR